MKDTKFIGKKKLRSIISLWSDNDKELIKLMKKYDKVYEYPYIGSQRSDSITKNALKSKLMNLEIEKLCAVKMLDTTKADGFKTMLKGSDINNYLLAEQIIILLREQRVNTDYA